MNHTQFGASVAVDEKPVADMPDIINSLSPIEPSDLFFVIQVDCHEFIANFWQQLAVVDRTEFIHIDEVFVRVYSGLYIFLLESNSSFPAVSLCLLEPSELIEAVSVEQHESDHGLVELLIHHG